ncbi:MAG: prenyltransferase [Gammaproteobacteria bacterium]|nr:prenyltransferase [Gammaproteobacteria bacterium]
MEPAVSAPRPSWLAALNPPIYLVSILPGLGVFLLAADRVAAPSTVALATLAVVLLQHGINLLNDAADWRLGADVEKFTSWVRFHDGEPATAARHGLLSLLAGGLLGLYVLWLGQQWWILLPALPLVLLGYAYNAGDRPLSYTHFGEWVTGVCYGPGVFGCLWLVAGFGFDTGWWLGSFAFGLLAVALLLSHQPPQIATDREAGKLSFAVRYGGQRTVLVVRVLFLLWGLLVGAGLYIAVGNWPGLLFGVAILIGVVRVWMRPVSPKPVLLSATALTLVGLSLQALVA